MAESATKAMMIIVSPRIPKNIVQNSVRNMKRFTVQSPENPAGVNRPLTSHRPDRAQVRNGGDGGWRGAPARWKLKEATN